MAIATEVRPVTVATLDGESREARMFPDGTWACPFCECPVFLEGHEYYRPHDWEGPCSNPGCVVGGAMTVGGTAAYRRREDDRKWREERRARWQEEQAERQCQAAAEVQAADGKRARLAAQGEVTRAEGIQLGFAWHCFAGECEVTGHDRSGFAAHAKADGRRSMTAPKLIRLRKGVPAARLGKLEVDPFAAVAWTQEHTTPGTCECGHTAGAHKAWHGNDSVRYACGSCECSVDGSAFSPPVRESAERCGQFWANGPGPHSVWVLPSEPAPWEDGRAAPVLLYVGSAGRLFTESYSAKYDRR